MNNFIEQLSQRKSEIISLIIQHIELTLLAVLVAIVIGVPLGIFITKHKKLAGFVIGIANLIQAVPSLAILGFLIPIIGIGSAPAITMVVLYSMLPIIKNAYTGIININPDMLEAAKGLGMTNRQTLKLVKIPLAMPVMMAGIRMASVTAVGLMTISAFVGAGGLGYMVFTGIQTVDNNLVLIGAIPAAILALAIDYLAGRIESATMPNGIKKADGSMKTKRNGANNKNKRNIIISILLSITLVGAIITSTLVNKNSKKIVIGARNFTEQLVLGNVLSELIKDNTDLKVDEKFNLGGSQVIFNAAKSGSVDAYVEYLGTSSVNVLKMNNITKDKKELYDTVKQRYNDDYGQEVLNPLGFNNTYTMAVTKDIAKKYNLNTISDLAKVSNELTIGPTMEFTNRVDGLKGLKSEYNMEFKDIKPIDGGLRYNALNNHESDVIDAFTTDGLIEKFDLKLLKDDKGYFPPYDAVTIIRSKTLEKYPELKGILAKLDGKLTDDKMRKLNYKVDIEKKSAKDVAIEFLKSEGLIK